MAPWCDWASRARRVASAAAGGRVARNGVAVRRRGPRRVAGERRDLGAVRYSELWPGIDVTFRGTGSELEWDLHVAAGADPAVAGMSVAGADAIDLDGDRATLVIGDDELGLAIPAVWQVAADGSRIERRRRVAPRRRRAARRTPGWDPTLAGVIDPTLEWSTYLGGGPGGMGNDYATDVAVDAAGNAYLTGTTGSADFPTTAGALDATLELQHRHLRDEGRCHRQHVALQHAHPGHSSMTAERAVAVDGAGNVVPHGRAGRRERRLPRHAGCLRRHTERVRRAVRDEAGRRWRPRLRHGAGRQRRRRCTDIAVDGDGAAYVVGSAGSGHPTTPGAVRHLSQRRGRRVRHEAQPGRERLEYSTLLGGGAADTRRGIAIDAERSRFVTGTSRTARCTSSSRRPWARSTPHTTALTTPSSRARSHRQQP